MVEMKAIIGKGSDLLPGLVRETGVLSVPSLSPQRAR